MGIADKLAKPVVEIIDHIARKVPKGLGHGHHRIADHVHKAANHPVMYHYEGQVARAVANGDHAQINYKVTPVYSYYGEGPMRPEDLRPIGMMIEAHSPDGQFEFTPYDARGAHRQELHLGPDGKLNRVFVLNVPKCAT